MPLQSVASVARTPGTPANHPKEVASHVEYFGLLFKWLYKHDNRRLGNPVRANREPAFQWYDNCDIQRPERPVFQA